MPALRPETIACSFSKRRYAQTCEAEANKHIGAEATLLPKSLFVTATDRGPSLPVVNLSMSSRQGLVHLMVDSLFG